MIQGWGWRVDREWGWRCSNGDFGEGTSRALAESGRKVRSSSFCKVSSLKFWTAADALSSSLLGSSACGLGFGVFGFGVGRWGLGVGVYASGCRSGPRLEHAYIKSPFCFISVSLMLWYCVVGTTFKGLTTSKAIPLPSEQGTPSHIEGLLPESQHCRICAIYAQQRRGRARNLKSVVLPMPVTVLPAPPAAPV